MDGNPTDEYEVLEDTLELLRRLCASGRARQLREEAGVSLKDAAAAVGVNIGQLSRWERGERQPLSSGSVYSYADFLADLWASSTARSMASNPEGTTEQ